MHEFSLVSSLADTIQRHLPPDGRLVSASVVVGELEHLDPVLIQTAWEAVMEDQGSAQDPSATEPRHPLPRLHLTPDPIQVRCKGCGHEYAPPDPAWMVCPSCGAARPEVLAGVGVTLLSLEVERPTAAAANPDPSNPRT